MIAVGFFFFLLAFIVAVFNIAVRRKPLITFNDNGIDIRIIGKSTLARIPVPKLVFFAWRISGSGQAFRVRILSIRRDSVLSVSVQGLPMDKKLVIQFELIDKDVNPAMQEFRLHEAAIAGSIRVVEAEVLKYCVENIAE